jgi:hypothetical protein
MPNILKNTLRKNLIIIAMFLLSCAALAGCTGTSELKPTILPVATPPAEISPIEVEDLFERYTVVGIDRDELISVHKNPAADSPVVGQIPADGTDIRPDGQIQQVDDITWLFISYQQTKGWVDQEFLAEQHGTPPADLIILSQQVLKLLKTGEYNQIIPFIHPESCLRFSPYQYLNNDNKVICPSELDSFTSTSEPFTWGHYDGTGKPISLTFTEYHQQFVYDQDYLKPSVVGFNVEVSSGNSINNIQEIYPDGMMIEYYFPGIDPRYDGMDWRSLRLVFIQENDHWYLTAIIHGEWTI